MGASGYPAVLIEIKEVRADIHKLDIKVESHLAQDTQKSEELSKVTKEVFNSGGIRERVSALEFDVVSDNKQADKKERFSLDIKSSLFAGSFVLAINLLTQWLLGKIF